MLHRNAKVTRAGKRVSLLFLERFADAGDDKLHVALLKHTGLRLPRAPAMASQGPSELPQLAGLAEKQA